MDRGTLTRRAVLLSVAVFLALPAFATAAPTAKIRRADFELFPQVRVTVLLPEGAKPSLFENGHAAAFASVRQLGAAEALVLAVDNSASMRGAPLREAKRAAQEFLGRERRASSTGLVVFGHEALALTRPQESSEAVSRTLMQLQTDPQTGTALYDAVVSSARRFESMSAGTKILVLLTDGHDVGSRASLEGAIRAAQRGSVIVYAIAVGHRADHSTLARLAVETGGSVFEAGDVSQLGATYEALSRELDRTWQISYLSGARPGDRLTLSLVAGSLRATSHERVPAAGPTGSGLLPARLAHSGTTAAVFVLLCAILLAAAGAMLIRRRQKPTLVRLLQPHVDARQKGHAKADLSGRLEALTVWTEAALADLPGSNRLARSVERSGWKLRVGHVPYLALGSAFALGILGTLAGVGPLAAVILLVIGLALPFVLFRSLRRGDAKPSTANCRTCWRRSRRVFARGTAFVSRCGPSRTTAVRRHRKSSAGFCEEGGSAARSTKRSRRCASGSGRPTSSTLRRRSTCSLRLAGRWRRSSTHSRRRFASGSGMRGRFMR